MGDTRTISAPPESEARELPPWLRPVVYGFLAVFIACGLFSVEVWPFTGFRLYSQVRYEARRGTAIVAVMDDGTEQLMSFPDFPLGWHNTNLIAKEFGDLTQAERDEICEGWAVPLEDDGLDVVEIRVETVVTHLSEPDRPSETVDVPYRCEL